MAKEDTIAILYSENFWSEKNHSVITRNLLWSCFGPKHFPFKYLGTPPRVLKVLHFSDGKIEWWACIIFFRLEMTTISASIDRWRFIKFWGLFGGCLSEFFLPQNASKSGHLGQKSGCLFKFCYSGGLIKSGAL